MSEECPHVAGIRDVTPSALGCEECLKIGSAWVHLRLCRTCGHVGCCDSSPHRHATKHFHKKLTILSSKATTRRKDGAGAMSIRSFWISATGLRRIMDQFRATTEAGRGVDIGA